MSDQPRKAGVRTIALRKFAQALRELQAAVSKPDVLPSATVA